MDTPYIFLLISSGDIKQVIFFLPRWHTNNLLQNDQESFFKHKYNINRLSFHNYVKNVLNSFSELAFSLV